MLETNVVTKGIRDMSFELTWQSISNIEPAHFSPCHDQAAPSDAGFENGA
jgi:hypothetical protein